MTKSLLVLLVCLGAAGLSAQQLKSLPSAKIKTLEGQTLDVTELGKTGKNHGDQFLGYLVLPLQKELDAIKDYYEEWQEKYNMELVAISVDDPRTVAKVPAMVAQKGWKYRILHDFNKEFQQAANVASVPFTIMLDAKGNVVYEHTGYAPGDELELEDRIKELVK